MGDEFHNEGLVDFIAEKRFLQQVDGFLAEQTFFAHFYTTLVVFVGEHFEPVDGINPTFGLDTNGKSTPVLLVATSVPVTLENIKLTGGYISLGRSGTASDAYPASCTVTISGYVA